MTTPTPPPADKTSPAVTDEAANAVSIYADDAGNTFQMTEADAKARGFKPAGGDATGSSKAVTSADASNKAVDPKRPAAK